MWLENFYLSLTGSSKLMLATGTKQRHNTMRKRMRETEIQNNTENLQNILKNKTNAIKDANMAKKVKI